MLVSWAVNTHVDFDEEFKQFPEDVQDSILEKTLFIEEIGHSLGRPHVDTLKGSKHPNMKELRLDVKNGVWRVAFAFEPKREAILLIAGDKAGKNQKRFYKTLIKKADQRLDEHLDYLMEEK